MKKKTKKVSLVKKFFHWKYSGLIVVPTVIISILFMWFSYTSTLEFYDQFSCEGLINYVTLDKELGTEIPRHNELTEEQHLHLHEILQPCLDEEFVNVEHESVINLDK